MKKYLLAVIFTLLLLSPFSLVADEQKPAPIPLEVGQKFLFDISAIDSSAVLASVTVTISSIASDSVIIVCDQIDHRDKSTFSETMEVLPRDKDFVTRATQLLPPGCVKKTFYTVDGYKIPCVEVRNNAKILWITIDGDDAVFPGHVFEKHYDDGIVVELVRIIMPKKKKKARLY